MAANDSSSMTARVIIIALLIALLIMFISYSQKQEGTEGRSENISCITSICLYVPEVGYACKDIGGAARVNTIKDGQGIVIKYRPTGERCSYGND